MARPWGCFFISGKVSFWPKVPVQEPRTSGVFFGVPGMTHRPPFQTRVWNMMVRRYRTEGRRQQGKGIARDGVSEGSMRQNLCT